MRRPCVAAADELGFDVHSAWPSYRDSLDVYWHKKVLPGEEKLRRATRHLGRSRLELPRRAKALSGRQRRRGGRHLGLDRSTGSRCRPNGRRPFGDSLPRVIASLAALRETIRSDGDSRRRGCRHRSHHRDTRQLPSHLQRDRAAGCGRRSRALTQSDPAFINTWGQPAHFLVIRKRLEASQEDRSQ